MKTIIAALCATLATRASGAQTLTWARDLCADSTRSAPYSECVLAFEGGRLVRGWPSEVVAIDDPRSPIALRRYVRGEPARQYARRYEHETRLGLLLRYGGATLILGQSVADMSHGRNFGDKTSARTARVMTIGLGLLGSSYPFRWLAWRDGERAVAAHNAGLSR